MIHQQKKEFNVKVVHTKLSSSNSTSNTAPINKGSTDDKYQANNVQRARQSIKMNSASKTIIHNFVANIFIKEFNLVLYNDHKDNLYKKNNIASIFLDDFIVCYTEEVRIYQKKLHSKFLSIPEFHLFSRRERSNSVLEIFKWIIICIQRENMIFQ